MNNKVKEQDDFKKIKFKKGQIWWDVSSLKIQKIEYVCEFPFNNPINKGSYDIIIYKDLDEPKRIYRLALLDIIERNKHITSYEEAKVEHIKKAEENLQSIKRIYGE